MIFAEGGFNGDGAAEIILQADGDHCGQGGGQSEHTHHGQADGEAQPLALNLNIHLIPLSFCCRKRAWHYTYNI